MDSLPTYLVDTDVLSDLVRPRPNAGVLAWATTVATIAVSAVTLEEVFYGLSWRPNARVRAAVEAFLSAHAVPLPVTSEIARLAGTMRGDLARNGRPRSQADMMIAATAVQHQLSLVTRNVRDFEGCYVPLLNPFS